MSVSWLINAFKSNALRMKRAVANGGLVMTGLLTMRLSAFIVSVIVARSAGAETFGQYTLFITIFILASEIPHAFDTAYLRATGLKNGVTEKHLYAGINAISKVFLLFLVTTILYLSSDFISEALGKQQAGKIYTLAVLCGGLNSIYMLIPAMAQQKKDFRSVAILKPVFNLLVLFFIVAIFLLDTEITIVELYNTYFFVGIVLSLFAVIQVFKRPLYLKKNIDEIRKYLIVALILLASTALSMLGNRMDVFFLGYYLDFEQLGVYGVALRISVIVSVMTAVMSTIMIPRAAEASIDERKFKQYIKLGVFYSVVQFLIAMLLLVFIQPLIVLVFGGEYINATLPAVLLILQVLILTIAIPYQALLQCGSRPSLLIYIAALRLFFSVPLMFFLVPRYDVAGAAIAVTSTTLFVSVVIIALAIRYKPTGQSDMKSVGA